jgi:hypothetical protein
LINHSLYVGLYVQLDSALLTDEEMVKYNDKWSAVPDPEHPGINTANKKAKTAAA